jgi:hypothetical protein
MAAVRSTEHTGTPIEALFRPSSRFRDSHLNRRGRLHESWTEVELLQALAPEDVLATGTTWEVLDRFLRDKVAWMTPDVYVSCSQLMDNRDDPLILELRGKTGTAAPFTTLLFMYVHVRLGTDAADAAATATCEFSLRLAAASELCEVCICRGGYDATPPTLSGAALSFFFQESRESLRKVTLDRMVLSAEQCLEFATMSRLDVELAMRFCILSNDAGGAFVECLQSDRGPIQLSQCRIDSQILASALAGNSRVVRLTLNRHWRDDAAQSLIFRSLASNRGLVYLNLRSQPISMDNWSVLCKSLQAHPTLASLDLFGTGSSLISPTVSKRVLWEEQKAHRTRMLAEMMQENIILHTIALSGNERDDKIFTEEVLPHLETNQYRPRVLGVKETTERHFREQVLGRALACVRFNPNLVWMFLSENVDALVHSEEESTG